MNIHADKKHKRTHQSVANNVEEKRDKATGFELLDNRSEAIAQRKIKEIENQRAQVVQLERGRSRERNSPQDIEARRNRQRYSSVDRRFGRTQETSSDSEEEKEQSSSQSAFTRTGHALSAHATSAGASVARAVQKGNTYNGRWKNNSVRDELIQRFYGHLSENKLKKGAYFVRCHIPLSVGCADDQSGGEHVCDGFFIKMTKMGSSKKKWKFSTCYPALESEIKGNVAKVNL
ncbi:hypothetical protein KORDIASMS9_03007 [Kordia sp. SMS9]|uniref:hypothetical protein n=1 Tax=Kordia sp. SMS9 TaxID=2282170 RepID=UPI000E0D261D|nr:hypothetical protein [Kordia sp. SMS9]AXG70761.1 hypothetical protein KORDIASMS9_03007 [Kordia sp. SMS9]